MKPSSFTFAVALDGTITSIYDDALTELIDQGTARITRASHVEPNPNGSGWIADMSPMGGPLLGPAPLRELALQLEVGWLESKLFT